MRKNRSNFIPIILIVLLSSTPSAQERYIPQGQIATLIRSYILKQLGGKGEKFQVEVLHIPQNVDAQLELRVIPSPRASYLGTYLVKLGNYSQGTLIREIPLVVRVREMGEVLVANKLIDRHQILTPEEVRVEERKLPLTCDHPLRRLEEVIGKRSARRINRGAILTAELVETIPLVRRGEVINLTLRCPGLCLMARGRALKDGWEGDFIRVKVLASGKELQAKIEKGKVQILN